MRKQPQGGMASDTPTGATLTRAGIKAMAEQPGEVGALSRLVLRLADALGELGAAVAADKTAYPMPSAPDPEPRLTAAECAARSLLTELGKE